MVVYCKKCKKKFLSDKGHEQHLNKRPDCMNFFKQTLGFGAKEPRFPEFAFEKWMPMTGEAAKLDESSNKRKESPTKQTGSLTKKAAVSAEKIAPSLAKVAELVAKDAALEATPLESADDEQGSFAFTNNLDNDDDHDDNPGPEDAEESEIDDQLFMPSGPDFNHDRVIIKEVFTAIHDKFKTYCEEAPTTLLPHITKPQEVGLRLLGILQKASLGTHHDVMLWHLRASGHIQPNEGLKDSNDYVNRSSLMSRLTKRYNMEDKFPSKKSLVLPFTGTKVDLVTYDAAGCIESLLTDPRLNDTNYLFYDSNPFADVPNSMPIYGDINTGRACVEAVKQYKKEPNHVVLPIIMYIDGATTGHMKDMPITALKMTLGIFNRSYRDQPHAWRVLGNATAVTKNISKARKRMRESRHVSASSSQMAAGEGHGTLSKALASSGPTRDLHAMLDKILESCRNLQDKGIKWELNYNGKLWDLVFIPFVLFIKCDTKEGDLLCGSYTSYTSGVANLCRYCCCPTKDSNNPQAYYDFKNVPMIKDMVDRKDLVALKKISQHCTPNAFWRIRFSPVNTRGIHGACASEILHAVELGMHMHLRDTFYEQVGPDSKAAEAIDEISQMFGMQFGRQSERNMPNCQFRNGIREGKLNAKEYHGVLLVLAAILHSTDGKEILLDAKWTDRQVDDWACLLEIALVWGAFIGQTEIPKALMGKLALRNRLFMWMIKKTAHRKEGMGLRLMKYHAITHLVSDIHNFGVPKNVYTGSDESGHKVTKIAASKTQKNMTTFEMQTATRESEFLVVELGLAELDGRKLWDYYKNEKDPVAPDLPPNHDVTGETTINVFLDKHNRPNYSIGKGKDSRTPSTKRWGKEVIVFLLELQNKVGRWMNGKLEIRSDHRRNGKVFRGHPNYRSSGEPWKDWVVVDLGEEHGHLPCQIWCFVVLRGIPTSNKKISKWKDQLEHGGISPLSNGAYAVVEVTEQVPRQLEWNQRPELLFSKVRLKTDGQRRKKMVLVSTNQFVEPCFVVPDFGGEDQRTFFKIANRDRWPSIFQEWMDNSAPPAYDNDKEGRGFETQRTAIFWHLRYLFCFLRCFRLRCNCRRIANRNQILYYSKINISLRHKCLSFCTKI